MEDRIVIAAALLLAMLLVGVWLISRKLAERQRFKQRQLGRGKSAEQRALEPAE
jgi:hypothetical protein